MKAPRLVSVAASTRNCQRIVPFVAPNALRTPISRVRSVTLIIMIATTPTPPTSRPTADSTIITRKNAPTILLYSSRIFSGVDGKKMLVAPGRRCRVARHAGRGLHGELHPAHVDVQPAPRRLERDDESALVGALERVRDRLEDA